MNLPTSTAIAVAAAMSIGLIGSTPPAGASLRPVCGVVPSPTVGSSTTLWSITAAGADDLWAVGNFSESQTIDQTLTEHWDGQAWSLTPSPSPGFDNLSAVSATGSTDVWAVGSTDTDTLIEHWDGAAWTVVPSPSPGIAAYLTGVAAVSPTDVWAVGWYKDEGNLQLTFAEHWDGVSWSVVFTPNGNWVGYNYLNDVAAVSSGDVWAVGYFTDASNVNQPLIQHWNGVGWTTIPAPGRPDSNHYLTGVAATSASDAWAVGYYVQTGQTKRTFTEHWDGTEWSIVPARNPGSSTNAFSKVTASSPLNVWAVGTWSGGLNSGGPLVERWDGSRWLGVLASDRNGSGLNDVVIDSDGTVWGVGGYYNGRTNRALIATLC